MDYKIELLILPVSDVDASKAFYADRVGFQVDHDQRVGDEIRFVQLTPPGSACSISFGNGLTDAEPGSVKGIQVVVASADQAFDELSARGVQVSPVQDLAWGRFVYFADPDGNAWALQELPIR
ncbi:catechol 2,3-dioxygenase-like lactoylglutathione lyase family enzyme [Nakamurella sp. UYEF19]|uniref:glyoxalase superfamily protein n=1 Tax=Nakamurella sp. UYEF19 TaxID=1756392 RepID=UPI0033920B9B